MMIKQMRTFEDDLDQNGSGILLIENMVSYSFLGPVRGICFHSQQPLFVSGGDDYKIKVNVKTVLMSKIYSSTHRSQ